jgi:anthranilate synthase component 2
MEVIALTNENEIMAIRHTFNNLRGVQFHPEAILTDHGFKILENWIEFNRIY